MLLWFPDHRDFSENPRIQDFFLKIQGIRDFFLKSRDSVFCWNFSGFEIFSENPRDLGLFALEIRNFLSLGILIPRIQDFSKVWDFHLRNFSKILGIRDFLPSGYPGVFPSGIEIFSGMGYSYKQPSLTKKILWLGKNFLIIFEKTFLNEDSSRQWF